MRMGLKSIFAVLLWCCVFVQPLAAEETLNDLKKQLDEAKLLIQKLEQRIEMVEKSVPAIPPPSSGAVVEVTESKEDSEGTFNIYGFVWTDYIQDFNRVDPDWNASLRPSKIPTIDGLYGEDGETIFSVRQTRLGVKAMHPTDFGDFESRVEVDFYGVGSDAGQTTIRPRHFYGRLGPILAGQTHSLFMDINVFPNTIDYWGPSGMVFLRNPQVRWTPISGDTTFAVALEKPGNDASWGRYSRAEETGSLDSKNELPDLTTRFNYKGDWGYVQAGGILRQVGFETIGNPGSNPSDDALGWGINLSTNIKTFERDRVIFSTVYGEAVANYMNDGGNDLVVVNGEAKTLPLLGMVAYYDHYWDKGLSSSIGYSFTRIDNHDAQANNSFKLGQYASANLLWTPWKNTMVGVEYLFGQREDKDGATGDDHRLQVSFKYSFDKVFGFDI